MYVYSWGLPLSCFFVGVLCVHSNTSDSRGQQTSLDFARANLPSNLITGKSKLNKGDKSLVDLNEVMEKVHALVDESELTVPEIAHKCGESEQKIRRTLEGKNPSFAPLCGIITACGGSVDNILGIVSAQDGTPNKGLENQLKADLRHERKRGQTGWGLFVCMVVLMMGILIFDILNPQFGWVRYEVAMQAAYDTANTAVQVLNRVLDNAHQFIL